MVEEFENDNDDADADDNQVTTITLFFLEQSAWIICLGEAIYKEIGIRQSHKLGIVNIYLHTKTYQNIPFSF